MNWQHYWKAIMAFVALLTTNIAYQLLDTSTPWPSTPKAWMVFLVTVALGTWLVYQKANAPADPDSER